MAKTPEEKHAELIVRIGLAQAESLMRGACEGTEDQRGNQIAVLEVTATEILVTCAANRIHHEIKTLGRSEFEARRSNIDQTLKEIKTGIEERYNQIITGQTERLG